MMSMKVLPEPPPGSGIVSGPVFTGSEPAQSGLGYCGPVMVTKLKHRVTPAAIPPDHVPPVNTWIPPPGAELGITAHPPTVDIVPSPFSVPTAWHPCPTSEMMKEPAGVLALAGEASSAATTAEIEIGARTLAQVIFISFPFCYYRYLPASPPEPDSPLPT